MKVLHVIHDFLPRYAAGSELFTYWLCRSLRRAGIDCEVFCADDFPGLQDPITHDEVDGIPVTRLQCRHFRLTNGINRWSRDIDRLFERELERVRPDVVHFHHFAGLSLGMASVVRRALIPGILTIHDYWLTCPRFHLITAGGDICKKAPGRQCVDCLWPGEHSRLSHPMFRSAVWAVKRMLPWLPNRLPIVGRAKEILRESMSWLADSRALLNNIDVVVAPTVFVADKLRERDLLHSDVRVIRNGVDTSRFAGISRPPCRKPRFGFIGSHSYKGLHVLIDAFESLPPGAAELHIYGRTPDALAARLERLASNGRVQVHGPFDPADISRVYESFDILVVPSLVYETSSLVIAEAFASGATVVASNIGAMREAVRDGIDGLLFERGNASELAAKLKRFIDDPNLAARLVSAARARTIEDTAREYQALYGDLIQEGSRRRAGIGYPA